MGADLCSTLGDKQMIYVLTWGVCPSHHGGLETLPPGKFEYFTFKKSCIFACHYNARKHKTATQNIWGKGEFAVLSTTKLSVGPFPSFGA